MGLSERIGSVKGSTMTMQDDLYSETSIAMLAGALKEIAELALAFGRIDRTGPCHPDGTPESDSDHTVMLGWTAPALAELINHRMGFAHYDIGLVAQFALVHDAAEVYAGDTCTIRITEDELAQKEDREAVATARLVGQFNLRLPWFARLVRQYEEQSRREARFVRAVDKVLPKMVHLVDGRIGLRQQGVTRAEFVTLVARQRAMVLENVRAGDYLILGVYDLLCQQVLEQWDDEALPTTPLQPPERHWVNTSLGAKLHHDNCEHHGGSTCPFTLAWEMCAGYLHPWPSQLVNGPLGEYELALDQRGLLIVKEN